MMATYFYGGSEMQENLQTLYLMNPNYNHHSYMPLPYALAHHAPPQHHQPISDSPVCPSSSPDRPGPDQGVLSLSLSPHHHRHGGEVIVGSKYLKAAQELLDEVVGVVYNYNYDHNESKGGARKEKAAKGESSGGSKAAVADEQLSLSPAQRQDLHIKKAKLLNMLDEVEQRYKEYERQMQGVATSFEQAAGMKSAKSYTSLALKTISRQFRCLKDIITSQIKEINKSLGEDEHKNEDGGIIKAEGGEEGVILGSRLRLVDQQLRQQRALQQLGMNMMPPSHNAWRPQRGLPERAVTVLRAWLFEHFLHPYPKDSDKHMLAKQTGLTRSQVSNWFINARVRLWKPMVEEMYLEEVKAQEDNTDDSGNNNTTTTSNVSHIKNDHNKDDQPISNLTVVAQQHEQQKQQHDRATRPVMIQTHQQPNPKTTNDMELLISSSKKQRTNNNNSDIHNSSPSSILSMEMDTKPPEHLTPGPSGPPGFNPVYVTHDIAGSRFHPDHLPGPYGNNRVSLTLGLPDQCEDFMGSQSSSQHNHHEGFLPNQEMQLGMKRIELGSGEDDLWGISMGLDSHPPTNNIGYESIDIHNHKRFAPHQFLHDFVA